MKAVVDQEIGQEIARLEAKIDAVISEYFHCLHLIKTKCIAAYSQSLVGCCMQTNAHQEDKQTLQQIIRSCVWKICLDKLHS